MSRNEWRQHPPVVSVLWFTMVKPGSTLQTRMHYLKCSVAFIAAVGCLAFVGCDKKPRNAQIQIEVFITTKGGENLRLGNVPVVAMPRDMLLSIAQKASAVAKEMGQNDKKLVAADLDVIKAARPLGNNSASFLAAKDALQEDIDKFNNLRFFLHDQLVEACKSNGKLSYTDANGVVTLTLPEGCSDYYIVATSERAVGRTTEKYCWLEPAQSTSTKLTLSNNNLWDAQTRGGEVGFTPLPALPDATTLIYQMP